MRLTAFLLHHSFALRYKFHISNRYWLLCRNSRCNNVATNTAHQHVPMPVSTRWKVLAARPRPVLQSDFSQHEVQAYSFVRSPITMQPASQFTAQRRSSDHIFGALVEFSVLVVYEKRLTIQMNSSPLHLRMKLVRLRVVTSTHASPWSIVSHS